MILTRVFPFQGHVGRGGTRVVRHCPMLNERICITGAGTIVPCRVFTCALRYRTCGTIECRAYVPQRRRSCYSEKYPRTGVVNLYGYPDAGRTDFLPCILRIPVSGCSASMLRVVSDLSLGMGTVPENGEIHFVLALRYRTHWFFTIFL